MQLLTQMYGTTERAMPTAFDAMVSSLFVYGICCLMVLIAGLMAFLLLDLTKRDFGKEYNILVIAGLLLILFFPLGHIVYYFAIMQRYPKKGAGRNRV